MSLADWSKNKALRTFEDAMRQAFPDVHIAKGSPVRNLFLNPGALMYAVVFQQIEAIRQMHLGNFGQLAEADMDQLLNNILQERSAGSRATANLNVYLPEPSSFVLRPFPYFRNDRGVAFAPIERIEIGEADVLTDNQGRFYVIVPVVSQTRGQSAQSAANTITQFNGMPVPVDSVSNPQATQGGRPRQTNEQAFQKARRHFSNPTINQDGGVRAYIENTYGNIGSIKVISPGNPRMQRDEIWTVDSVTPNLERQGTPWAEHTDVGTLDFDVRVGRAKASSAVFDPSMEGSRIAIDGDANVYRTIQSVVSTDEVVLSGYPLTGTADAKVWGEGPHKHNMSDVYMYFPALQVQTTVIDKSIRLQIDGAQTLADNRLYYTLPDNESATGVPAQGRLVVGEGTDDEVIFQVNDQKTDGNGPHLVIDEGDSQDQFQDGEIVRLYDHEALKIASDGDITGLPAIYVLDVRALDPVSLEDSAKIPQSRPGVYAEPGWYIRNADPIEAFSAREDKELVIDDKWDVQAFRPLLATADWAGLETWYEGSVSTTDLGSDDTLKVAGEDLSGFEGRDISFVADDTTLNGDSTYDNSDGATSNFVNQAACTELDSIRATVAGLNLRYFTDKGYRDENWGAAFFESNDGGATFNALTQKFSNNGDFVLYGDTLEMTSGSLPSPQAGYDLYVSLGIVDPLNNYTPPSLHEAYPRMAEKVESVVLRASGDEISFVTSGDPLVAVADANGLVGGASLTVEADRGDFGARPLRVTYATHSAIAEVQEVFDDGDIRAVCEDSLARSMFPSLIDVEIEYRGPSTPQELQSEFTDVLEQAVQERDDGNIRLDISNAISALDEEGLDDVISVLPEVRVESYLPDGEREVRYLNPSEETVQTMAVKATTSPGADQIDLVRLDSTATPPGRGKLFLGGVDPNRQEILPYEAIIEEDDTLTVILRTGYTTSYEHRDYEQARVAHRDYDPALEYKDGTVIIPETNRPWIRRFRVIERSQ